MDAEVLPGVLFVSEGLYISRTVRQAAVAQLVEQLICNHQVGGSNPFGGSRFKMS